MFTLKSLLAAALTTGTLAIATAAHADNYYSTPTYGISTPTYATTYSRAPQYAAPTYAAAYNPVYAPTPIRAPDCGPVYQPPVVYVPAPSCPPPVVYYRPAPAPVVVYREPVRYYDDRRYIEQPRYNDHDRDDRRINDHDRDDRNRGNDHDRDDARFRINLHW